MKTRRTCWVVGVALCGGAIWGQSTRPGVPFTVSREVTAITEPLRKDGTPDYLAAYRARYPRAEPEENAFVGLVELVGIGPAKDLGLPGYDAERQRRIDESALRQSGARPASVKEWKTFDEYLESKGLDPEVRNGESMHANQAYKESWSATDFPLLAEYLKENDRVVSDAARAMSRPRWWVPMGVDGEDLGLPVAGTPYLTRTVFPLVELVGARATLRAHGGDLDGAISDALALESLGRHMMRGGSAVDRLMGIAVISRAAEIVGVLAGNGKLNAAQCGRLQRTISELPPMGGAGGTIQEPVDIAMRWSALEWATSCAAGRWTSVDNGKFTEEFVRLLSAIDREAVDWDRVLLRLQGVFDRAAKDALIPGLADFKKAREKAEGGRWNTKGPGWTEKVPSLERQPGETREAYTNRIAEAFEHCFEPRTSNLEELARRAQMMEGMANAMLVVAAEKARTGRFPDVARTPRDIYSPEGWDVQYVVRGEVAGMRSVGDTRRSADGQESTQQFQVGVLAPR